MEIIGYFASVLIGISLGLIGSGGSIVTIPLLVYLFSIEPVLATTYSLFIVGATSLVGSVTKIKQRLIDYKTGSIFALPALLTVFVTRRYLLPGIPQKVITVHHFVVTRPILLLVLFAVVMVFASVSMISDTEREVDNETGNRNFNYRMIFLQGALVGLVTGLVGAGGGFLIIPALVLFSKLPMKKAIGTSLLIIAINSLFGFLTSLAHDQMHWGLLFTITILAIMGIFAGNWLSHRISPEKLKKGFGWFILFMGVYIIIKELFL